LVIRPLAKYLIDDSRLPRMRQKMHEPEQDIAIDGVDISRPFGLEYPQCQVSDSLRGDAARFNPVNNRPESGGIAGIQLCVSAKGIQSIF